MKKRLFAGLLALALCLGVLPGAALAAGPAVESRIDVAELSRWYQQGETEDHISTASSWQVWRSLIDEGRNVWRGQYLYQG